MTKYPLESFEELNRIAQAMNRQNRQYLEAGNIKHARHSAIRQNQLAQEQSEYVQVLGELVAEAPYEELALEYLKAEDQLAAAEVLSAEHQNDRRKYGAIALADAVIEGMPWAESVVEANLAKRLAEIDEISEPIPDPRTEELRKKLAELSLIYEIAGQAWPVPIAREVEVPAAEEFIRNRNGANGSLNGNIESTTAGAEIYAEPVIVSHETTAERVREFVNLRRYQPKAKALMTYYFTENPERTVTVDELMDFIYSHVPACDRTLTLRNSITTMLGPKIQGKEMQKMLAAEGLKLQYGWQIRIGQNGTRTSRHRVYRAVPSTEPQEQLPVFEEEVQIAA
jgi:hypothetical protein